VKDERKTKRQLIDELTELRRRVDERRRGPLPAETDKPRTHRKALAAVGIGLDTVSTDYRILSQNSVLVEQFGDLTGELCYKSYVGRDEPCEFCPMKEALASGGVARAEITGADGRTYEIVVAPLVGLDGVIDRVAEVFYDITDRKRAEERIAHLHTVLRAIRNVNEIITTETDRDRRIEKACKTLIQTRAYRTAWMVHLGEDGTLLAGAEAGLGEAFGPLKDALKAGQLPACARRAARGTGVVVVDDRSSTCADCPLCEQGHDAAAMTVRLKYGGKLRGILCVSCPLDAAEDEEEQRLLKEAASDVALALHNMEAQEERKGTEKRRRLLSAVVEQTTEGVAVAGLDGNLIFANQAWAEMHGYESGDELVGRNLSVFYSEEQLANEVRPFNRKVMQDGRHTGEVGHIRTDGTTFPLLMVTTLVRDGQGDPIAFADTATDVTELKCLEQQLCEAARMESVGRLAGGVAHDFNNLLTGIMGYAQILSAQFEEGTPARRDLGEIRKLGERAATLTRQLLAFSRRQIFESVVLNINDLVENVSKMLARLISEDINLHFIPADDLGNVRADPAQIEQVLMNFAINARDAMPEGGKLTIETGNVVLDQEYADRHVGVTPGAHVMLAVSDTGVGMDAETREHIFEPFFTTKEAGKGTGLGLATVYGIVKQHDGNIWVYSEPGKGTTFKVYLPLVEAEVEASAAKEPEGTPAVGTETILLVEDEESLLKLAERILAERGYTVLTAASPSKAREIFKRHGDRIDLLVTDVVLPECNGRQLYEELVAQHPSLKVLYASGYTANAIAHRGVLAANTAFLQKPFTPDGLAGKVREVLDS